MKRYILLPVLFVLFLLPPIILAITAVSASWPFPLLLPERFSMRAPAYLLEQWADLLVSIGTSLLYSLLAVALTFIMCILPARAFAFREFAGKRTLEALFLAPAVMPAMAFSMGIHIVFIVTGLADTLAGVVLVLSVFSYPYMLRALIAGYGAVGEEYGEAARNLGAGFWRSLFAVDVPMLTPAITAGGTVVFLVSFSEYFLVFLIGGGAVPSFTGYLVPFLGSSDFPVASLLTLLFLAVPVLLFFGVDLTVERIYTKRGIRG